VAILQGNAKQGSTRGFYPKTIEGSLRFNDDDSAYLEWTPIDAGTSSTIWTFSWWQKSVGANNSGTEVVFGAADGSNRHMIRFDGSGQLEFVQHTTTVRVPTAKFRDPSAWYHFVVNVSGSSAAIYVNGEEITDFTTSNSPSGSWYIGNQYTHRIGRDPANADYQDGYLAEVFFIDGTAHNADAFGETKNGVWVPKNITATDFEMGTNGFHLTFQDDTAVEAFNTVLYRGNGLSSSSVTGMGFEPDLVWIKARDGAYNHILFDSVRGVGKYLTSSQTFAENWAGDLFPNSEPTTNGFIVDGHLNVSINESGKNYVAWNWKAGTSVSGSTTGSGTSQSYTGSVSPISGFGIIGYAGNGTAGHSIPHHLDSAPEVVIVKRRTGGDNWAVTTPDVNRLYLNGTNDAASINYNWADQDGSVVTLNGTDAFMNATSNTYIMYCFHSVEGFSKFGSYEGGSDAFVYTGFRPAMIICKNIDSGTAKWGVKDSTRSTINPTRNTLYPNDSLTEYTGTLHDVDFLSNGFKLRNADAVWDGSGTYIYMAFAENPFKYSNAR